MKSKTRKAAGKASLRPLVRNRYVLSVQQIAKAEKYGDEVVTAGGVPLGAPQFRIDNDGAIIVMQAFWWPSANNSGQPRLAQEKP
jgi:hypothetical protein